MKIKVLMNITGVERFGLTFTGKNILKKVRIKVNIIKIIITGIKLVILKLILWVNTIL
jgi:hypothetical protein